ncbi:MAG: hypothetical protein Q9209_001396 [Squamulea sp. 1 TL-2023]
MPLRMEPSAKPSAFQPSTSSASSAPPPSKPNPTALPPAAIDLATRLFNAARTGDLPIFQQAIPAGLPVNLTNDKGDTLVHNHPPSPRPFIQEKFTKSMNNADPNTLNDRGQSPLAGAVFKAAGAPVGSGAAAAPEEEEGMGDADMIVEMLLDAGADVAMGRPSARESVEMFRVERWRERICGGRGG